MKLTMKSILLLVGLFAIHIPSFAELNPDIFIDKNAQAMVQVITSKQALYYSDPETASTLLFWMMGSFSNSDWGDLPLPLIAIIVGLLLFVVFRRWIGAIQAGDEGAFTLGIPVSQLRLAMLVLCSIITAVLVAQVGGIGFVGLMIPHICRFIVGSQLHKVLFMCVTLGGSFMVWVDVIAHTILESQVLPVGIVTSAIGSLFFFVILKTRSRT